MVSVKGMSPKAPARASAASGDVSKESDQRCLDFKVRPVQNPGRVIESKRSEPTEIRGQLFLRMAVVGFDDAPNGRQNALINTFLS